MRKTPKPVVEKVAIIGAGLGGLATAIALRKQGIDAHVYEKAREFSPVGAGLGKLRTLNHHTTLFTSKFFTL